jgi:hypothetical protein
MVEGAGHSQKKREERNWPFSRPPVGHWDDTGKLQVDG